MTTCNPLDLILNVKLMVFDSGLFMYFENLQQQDF